MALQKFLSEEDDPNVNAYNDDDVDMEEPGSNENEINNEQELQDDNDDKGNVDKPSTLEQINQILSHIPHKIDENFTKTHFCLIILLIVEVKNAESEKEKIDYLLLYSFLKIKKEFESISDILKLKKEEFIKIFDEKTDFDTTKISEMYDAFSADDGIKSIVDKFKENMDANKINIEQTMSKIIKCELNTQVNENDEEKKDSEEWKQFKVGDKIDVLDKWKKWYLAEILKHKQTDDENMEAIYVHYVGFPARYDDWVIIKNGQSDRIAAPNTKSEKRKKKKEQQQKEEGIIYKIKDFEKLIKYIDSEYEAPKGRNRSGIQLTIHLCLRQTSDCMIGIGAEKYAHAQKHGPGGNLTKFVAWDKNKQYDRFHHSHYDWWMFPNDRDSWGQGRKYALFQNDIDDLLQLDGYKESYKLGARLVLRSWGWDMDKMEFIKDGTSAQKWTGYNVRLLKMLYSTIILKQWDVYQSVYKFCIGLLEKGDQFRSEPMMYEYLGLEKPKFRSYRW